MNMLILDQTSICMASDFNIESVLGKIKHKRSEIINLKFSCLTFNKFFEGYRDLTINTTLLNCVIIIIINNEFSQYA